MTAKSIANNVVHQFNLTMFNTSAANYFEPLIEKYFPNKSLVRIKAEVINIFNETDNVISIILKPNKNWKGFIPGQYVDLGVTINAVFYQRIFSISSTVEQFKNQHTITLTIQKQYNGKITGWIFDNLEIGDVVSISEAKGDFINTAKSDKVLYIAGGSGITPFRPMLYECLHQHKNVVLLYYAKSNNHLFHEELNDLHQHKNINIHCISTDIDSRISAQHLNNYCSDFTDRKIFICGPNNMIEDTKALLCNHNVSEDNIVQEYFKVNTFHKNNKLENAAGTIVLNNSIIKTVGNKSILEQMESNGLKPKHGCRMGLCKECQCTKSSGVVYNKLSNKYSEDGSETIQICVSVPIGEVKIDL